MAPFLIFVGMALVTYATRYTMIAALGREVPPLLRRWLRYVPPAVLSALIVPAVLAPHDRFEIGPPVWAALAGAVIAWCSRSILWTILGGLGVFWVLKASGL